jgi:WD40 repeat protein
LNLSVEHQQQQRSTSRRNSTYEELNRQWGEVLPGDHLHNLVSVAVSSSIATENVVGYCAPSNLVDAANEAIREQKRNPTTGRTVQDAIDLESERINSSMEPTTVPVKPSLLHPPVKVDFDIGEWDKDGKATAEPRKSPPLLSEMTNLRQKSARAMRRYLELKVAFNDEADEIRKLTNSLKLHLKTKQTINDNKLLHDGAYNNDTEMVPGEEEQNADRVIAQLERKLEELTTTHSRGTEDLRNAKQQALSIFEETKKSSRGHWDPFGDVERHRPGFGANVTRNNGILRSLENRRLGQQSVTLANQGLPLPSLAGNRIRNALVESRLSHAVTINAHLQYPVFCLRFDRTGRYFVTGADDNLVKVFCLGAKQEVDDTGKGVLGQGQERTIRGAVLVCTLRGHASVICDIDISSDNCFIATASDDSDCRVWSLKDGAPVAILRGHVGGCNMVSWSKLTPFRLVTAGEDGYARTWDVREAALKRHRSVVGKRPEYALVLTQEERASNSDLRLVEQQYAAENQNVALPPIPDRQIQVDVAGDPPAQPDQGQALPDEPLLAPLPPPPLPPADGNAANGVAADQANDAYQNPNPNAVIPHGRFVANDEIDEGVRLLGKFLHGSSLEERMAAPGTRSRRAAVKIFCVVRCPLGGHFATGASDGICRIWEDDDDLDVETVDKRLCRSEFDGLGEDEAAYEKPKRSRRNCEWHLAFSQAKQLCC